MVLSTGCMLTTPLLIGYFSIIMQYRVDKNPMLKEIMQSKNGGF